MAENNTQTSRRFALVDLPDPDKIDAKFVYNFFTPDERTNSDGDARVPGIVTDKRTNRLVNAGTLNTEIPRYVELNYSPGTLLEWGNFGDDKNGATPETIRLDILMDEEDVTTDSFLTLSESDPDNKSRTSGKLNALSKLLDIEFSDSNQTAKLASITNVDKSYLQPLIAPNESQLLVNFVENAKVKNLYDDAATFVVNAQVNARTIDSTFSAEDDVSQLTGVSEKNSLALLHRKFIAALDKNIGQGDLDLKIKPGGPIGEADESVEPQILGVSHVGYTIEKTQFSPSGTKIGATEEKLILGTENKRFLDAEIVYGSKYAYSVRNIYRIDAILNTVDGSVREKRRITTYIKSKSSSAKTVETVEYNPPNPPDGVFYRYNYNKGRGLTITWQMPTGRSRDVKFFQVFRRKNIYEPFECIAELDFDDSELKTLRPESVREDLVFKMSGPQVYYEDSTFDRESGSAIYAVCALDAHGLTSGYSTQTEVGFDRNKNILTLKNISRPGAPKQYPNFFVDPDLDDNIAVDSFTQDAIFDSGRKTVRVYFTPDAKSVSDRDGQRKSVFVDQNTAGKYKMHFINLDLQKSTTAEIYINNTEGPS